MIAKTIAITLFNYHYSLQGSKHIKKCKEKCYKILDEKINNENNSYEIRHLQNVKKYIKQL